VGPRAGRDGRKYLVPTGIRSRTVQPVAQSLHRLSHPAHIYYIYIYVCVCVSVCIYACMYVCVCVCVCIYIYIYNSPIVTCICWVHHRTESSVHGHGLLKAETVPFSYNSVLNSILLTLFLQNLYK